MALEKTTTTGYGENVKNSFKGIGFGFILFIAGTVLLWWNEGRAVKTANMLNEAQGAAVHVEDISTINSDYNGKLIHATATIETEDALTDTQFGITTTAIKLTRNVEYYQWVEQTSTTSEDKLGGKTETKTTYTYERKWVSSPIESNSFEDPQYKGKNIAVLNVSNETFTAQNVKFGAYSLTPGLINSISGESPLSLKITAEQENYLEKTFADSKKMISPQSTTTATQAPKYLHVNGNTIYFGQNPSQPEIGDMRITFTQVLPGNKASVIALVADNNLTFYTAKNGKTISVLTMGIHTMEQMFESEEKSNSILTWFLRIAGLLVVIGGFKGIFGLLGTLLKVVPFLASIANFGIGIVSKVLGFVWSLIIIAIAWVVYRPVVAIVLVVIIAGTIYYFNKRGKTKSLAKTE